MSTRRRPLTQPRTYTGADPYWVEKGLSFLWHGGLDVDNVQRSVGMPNNSGTGMSVTYTKGIRGWNFAGPVTNQAGLQFRNQKSTLETTWIFMVSDVNFNTQVGRIFWNGEGNCLVNSNSVIQYTELFSTTNGNWLWSCSTAMSDSTPQVFAIVSTGVAGTTPTVYQNGSAISLNSTITASAGTRTVGVSNIIVGNIATPARQLIGKVYFLAKFNRAISANDVRMLTRDYFAPFRLCASKQLDARLSGFPAAAGGGFQSRRYYDGFIGGMHV